MAFVNEIVSDADIDRYHLPFRKGSGRYWTRDAERDYYLWGGLGGNLEYGEEYAGRFYLYFKGEVFQIVIEPGNGSLKYSEDPFIVRWASIKSYRPKTSMITERKDVIEVLKEALRTFGENGRENKHVKNLRVIIDF